MVFLLGWIALSAIRIAADLYLLRYRIDVEDNLLARKHVTQVRILMRAADTLVVTVTLAIALMTFESVRQYGVSLFASAGAAGLVVGLAARPVLSNLIAGVQIAMTQPIRIEDAVTVENEWGWIEEITSTYVVVRLWDLRRLIVPLNYFIEKPFTNWTREGSASSERLSFTSTSPPRSSPSAPRRSRSCRNRSCGTARRRTSRSPMPTTTPSSCACWSARVPLPPLGTCAARCGKI